MKKKYSSIVVTGSIALDEIMDFPGQFVDHFHPERLHQINVSFVVNRLEKQFGGIATNIAYNASLVTNTQIKVLSAVGKDGGHIVDFLKKRKINTLGILRENSLYTASGKVITDKKDNQIWGFYFGALEKSGDIDYQKHITPSSLVIVSPTHSTGFLGAQKFVIQKSLDYVYDPGMALTWISDEDLRAGVLSAAYLIGNDYEIAQICRRLKTTVAEITKNSLAVITTLGEKGALYQSRDVAIEVGIYKKCKLVDPTGAGDAFRGGFFAGVAEGKPISDSLKQAAAVASFAVEAYGTVNHHPNKAQIKKRSDSL